MERVSLLGSFIDVINAFRVKSEENERNTLFENREKILKEYGDKRLLVVTMAEKEFERISNDKSATSIRGRIKASGSANAGNSKDISGVEMKKTPIEENDKNIEEK